MKKIHKVLAVLVIAATLSVGAAGVQPDPADAAAWKSSWYGPIYTYNWPETNSIADSAWNIPQSGNPFAYIVPAYRFWWSQTAKTARMMGRCLGIHVTGSPQIVRC